MQTIDIKNIPAPTLAFLADILAKAAEEQRDELAPGAYTLDEIVTLKLEGTVKVSTDTERAPTCSIPLLPALALMVKRMGVQREKALDLLREVMTEALKLGKDASEELLAETGVAEAQKQLKEEVIAKLPKTPAKGMVKVKGSAQAIGLNLPAAE